MPRVTRATRDAVVPTMESRLVEFVQRLRTLGIPIGVDQVVSFAESFAWIQPLDRDEVYHSARATLVNRQEYLGLFDKAFSEFWEPLRASLQPQKTPQAPRHRPEQFKKSTLVSSQRALTTVCSHP